METKMKNTIGEFFAAKNKYHRALWDLEGGYIGHQSPPKYISIPWQLGSAVGKTLEEFLSDCRDGAHILMLYGFLGRNKDVRLITAIQAHSLNTIQDIICESDLGITNEAIDTAIRYSERREHPDDVRKICEFLPGKDLLFVNSNAIEDAYCTLRKISDMAGFAAYRDAIKKNKTEDEARAIKAAAEEHNKKLTADICRAFLPIEHWIDIGERISSLEEEINYLKESERQDEERNERYKRQDEESRIAEKARAEAESLAYRNKKFKEFWTAFLLFLAISFIIMAL